MSHHRVMTIAIIAVTTAACGPAVLDSSSPDALIDSVKEMRSGLDQEELDLFNDAFAYFTGTTNLERPPETLNLIVDACSRLQGLTAEQIIREAWSAKVDILEDRIVALGARRAASENARQVLSRLQIVEARFFPAAAGFVEQPVIEVKVENHARRPIFVLSFEASLRRPDEVEPWVTERLDRPIGVGLAPGRRARLRLETENEDWQKAGPGDIFECDVMRLVGRGGKVLADSDFGSIHEYQLERYSQSLEALRAEEPFK